MGWLRTFVGASAVTLSLVGAGHAADVMTLPPPASYMSRVAPSYVPRDIFLTGWYLRADIGERWGFMTAANAPSGAVST